MGRAAGETVRISQVDPPAHAGRERRQGRDYLLPELVHPAAAAAERPTLPLSRCKSRLAVPVSRTLRPSCLDVPVGGRASRRVRIESGHVIRRTTRTMIMAILAG